MKTTRRQLFATVLAGPIAAKLALSADLGQKLPKIPLREGICQFGVHLPGPLPKPFGGFDHLERVVVPGMITIRDLVEREGKGKPIRFLELEEPKAVEYCRLYAIGPMRVRETWAWDCFPVIGNPDFIGRLDALVQIG